MFMRCDMGLGGPIRGQAGVKSPPFPPMRVEQGVKSHACQPMRARLRRGGGVNFHTSRYPIPIGAPRIGANGSAIKELSHACCISFIPERHNKFNLNNFPTPNYYIFIFNLGMNCLQRD